MISSLRAAAAHVALALAVTWPIALQGRSALLGDPDVDVWNHAWGPWWWASALSQGELPWRTELLGAPDGGVLWFIDPILAALGAPLVGLVGPAAAFNVALVAYVAFASWAAHRLARALGASHPASWVASVAFAGSAWMVCELHNGITEAADIGPVALALAWGHEAVAARSWRAWAKAGLGVGLACVASPYLGLGAGIALAVRGLLQVHRAWLGAVVAAAVAAPVLVLMKLQLADPAALIKHPPEMNAQLALHNAVDPRTFWMPGGFRSVDLSAEGFEHSMYLGLSVLALALASRKGRAWWPAALTVGAFALGPYLFLGGDDFVRVGGAPLRLPWWGIQAIAPGLAVTHPLRLAVPLLALVGALAACGADRLLARIGPRWVSAVVGVVALDVLVLSGSPWPMELAPAHVPAVYAQLDGPGLGVLDLPTDVGQTMGSSRYLWWQTGHWRPIPYGPDARASTSAVRHRSYFQELAIRCNRRGDEDTSLEFQDRVNSNNPTSELAQAYDLDGLGWVVLHPELDPDAAVELQAWMTQVAGAPTQVDGALVWDLRQVSDRAGRRGPSRVPQAP